MIGETRSATVERDLVEDSGAYRRLNGSVRAQCCGGTQLLMRLLLRRACWHVPKPKVLRVAMEQSRHPWRTALELDSSAVADPLTRLLDTALEIVPDLLYEVTVAP